MWVCEHIVPCEDIQQYNIVLVGTFFFVGTSCGDRPHKSAYNGLLMHIMGLVGTGSQDMNYADNFGHF